MRCVDSCADSAEENRTGNAGADLADISPVTISGPTVHPSQRTVVAKSWWIASEIARRHPELRIIETRPYEGADDNLCLVHPRTDEDLPLIALDRLGALEASPLGGIGWDDVVVEEDPHAIVRALEGWAGLGSPPKAPATTPTTLVYRIIARILASLVEDRDVWNARWGLYDTLDEDTTVYHPGLDEFPTVDEMIMGEADQDANSGDFWVLERGEDAVACFDTFGRLHTRDAAPLDLMPIYRATQRSLTGTVGVALGRLLP
jgi:hypothetical protein